MSVLSCSAKNVFLGLTFTILILSGCMKTNEISGRSQFILIPASQDMALGLQAINEIKQSEPIQYNGEQADRIRRIGKEIAAMSDKPDFDWEFLLINEPILNAWALPGGKVAIYAKMAEALSDTELAAVLGHEIAHAVLRHGAEKISRAQVQQIAIIGVGVIATTQTDNETALLATTLASLAANGFVALPHSRKMELEADDIGTVYMALAGYDPRGAVSLWQTMSRLKGPDGKTSPFLSTHPSDDNRIDRLQNKMDEYLKVYRAAGT